MTDPAYEFNDKPMINLDWSSHGGKYVLSTGKTQTNTMIESAMQQHFFQILDKIVENNINQNIITQCLILCGGPSPESHLLIERYGKDNVRILTTDIAPGMLLEAQKGIDKAKLNGIVKVKYMDAMNLDLPLNHFDVVMMFFGIMFISDSERCFKEVNKVLKSDQGHFFLLTPAKLWILEIMGEEKKKIFEQNGKLSQFNDPTKSFTTSFWSTPEKMIENLSKFNIFESVQAKETPSFWAHPNEKDVDILLDSLFDNPAIKGEIIYNMTEDKVKIWQKAVRKRCIEQIQDPKGLYAEPIATWAKKKARD